VSPTPAIEADGMNLLTLITCRQAGHIGISDFATAAGFSWVDDMG
jgi:hypothetical protein